MVRGFSHLFVWNSFELFADTAQKKLRDPYRGAGPVMKCMYALVSRLQEIKTAPDDTPHML